MSNTTRRPMSDSAAEDAVARMLAIGVLEKTAGSLTPRRGTGSAGRATRRRGAGGFGPTLAEAGRRMEAAWRRGAVPAGVRGKQPPPEARDAETRGYETRVSAIGFRPATRSRQALPLRRPAWPTIRHADPAALPARSASESRDAQLERFYAEQGFVQRHEAGHVVAAWALGLDVQRVDTSGSGHFGVTELTHGTAEDDTALVLLVAGMRAERSHPSWHDELQTIWERTSDHDRVEEWIADLELSRSDELALRAEVVERADALLAEHHRRLDVVHQVLLDDRTLSGNRLLRLLESTA